MATRRKKQKVLKRRSEMVIATKIETKIRRMEIGTVAEAVAGNVTARAGIVIGGTAIGIAIGDVTGIVIGIVTAVTGAGTGAAALEAGIGEAARKRTQSSTWHLQALRA
jgi:hypothetical protein